MCLPQRPGKSGAFFLSDRGHGRRLQLESRMVTIHTAYAGNKKCELKHPERAVLRTEAPKDIGGAGPIRAYDGSILPIRCPDRNGASHAAASKSRRTLE
jgi:hypothetical protein